MPAKPARRQRLPAEQTRAQILEAAERRFAEAGFSDTRLEDVAADVGVRRAALFYYFKDKQELFRAVQQDVFASLLARVEPVLDAGRPLAERIEAGIEAWVDYVAERPSVARLILRGAADARSAPRFDLQGLPLLQIFYDLLAEGERSGELRPLLASPTRIMSAVAGTTVFHFAALPALLPEAGLDPHAPESLDALKRDVLRVAQRLLGIEPRKRRRSSAAPRAKARRR